MKILFIFSLLMMSVFWASSQNADTNPVMIYYHNAEELIENGEYKKAMLSNDSAFLLQKLSRNNINSELLYSQRGEIFFDLSNYDSAIANLQYSNKLLTNKGISHIVAKNNKQIGYGYGKLGNHKLASELLSKSTEQFIELNAFSEACQSINTEGLVHYEAGQYDSAMSCYLRCIVLAKNHNLDVEEISPLINISNIYSRTKDYKNALETLDRALEICKPEDSENRNNISQNIATIWMKMGNYEKALTIYKESIQDASKQNRLMDIAFLKSNIGIIYYKMGRTQEALNNMLESSNVWKQLNQYNNYSHLQNNIAVIYNKMGDNKNAIKSLLNSIEAAKKMNNKPSIAQSYKNIAQISKSREKYEDAFNYMDLYRLYRDSIFENKKIEYLSEQQVKFNKLQDETKIIQLENEKVKAESLNKTLAYNSRQRLMIFLIIIIVLVSVIIFYGWKVKKNNVIAEQKIRRIESDRKFETARYVIEGEEKERKRIAQELHDGIGVLLSTASIHFSNVEDKVDKGVGKIAAKAKDLLNEASNEIRTISHNMMPSVLSKFGLYEALSDIFESLDEDSGISTDFIISGEHRKLDENSDIMIYRLMQELVNNTIKHAKAKKVICNININDDKININYSDNGIGFNENSVASTSSFGLNGIKSRVDLLNGKMQNNSQIGHGASYSIEFPI